MKTQSSKFATSYSSNKYSMFYTQARKTNKLRKIKKLGKKNLTNQKLRNRNKV